MLALFMNKKSKLGIFLGILVRTACAAGLMAILSSCGHSPGYSYTISGTVSGMAGSGLVLQDNGGDDQTVTVDGPFSFQTALSDGSAYSVTVKTQPTNPAQTCVVSNGTGSINGSPVLNVAVSCTQNAGPVTVDPFGLFAYVSNANTNNIAGFTIDPSSSATPGALATVTGSPFPAGANPTQVTIDPSGQFAYAANLGSNTVSAYAIDTNSGSLTYGALTAISGSPYNAQMNPFSVTIYPYVSGTFASSGEFAYVPNMGSGNISAYTISSIDGSLSPITGSPFAAGNSPAGVTIYYVPSSTYVQGPFAYVPNMSDSTISAYTIGTDGSLTASLTSPTVSTGSWPIAIAVYADPGNKFATAYVATMGSGAVSVYTINTDGSLSSSGTTPSVTAGTYPASITLYTNATGAFAYVSNMGSANISVFAISSADGSLSPNPGTTVNSGTYPNPVAIYSTATTAFAYVSDRNDGTIWVYSINTSTGALTNIQQMAITGATSLTTVTIDPTGPYAYVSDSNFGYVYAFSIGSNGQLSGPL
ncbi:MAG TPA: beta-propeller fold lactonase family protein [Smithella sp.]|nr:beta-propeller fold lactonase family protein [Smithella sp.]